MANEERADRIMDAARELLLRWGYPKVTIADIAQRAGIGKGTIYLHWRSKDQVFFAVAAQEAVATFEAVVAAMRADPAEIALDRYLRRFYVEAMGRPVLRALFTRDAGTLGGFLTSPARKPVQGAKLLASEEYLGLLAQHGLLRDGADPAAVGYPVQAIAYGFFTVDPFLAGEPPDVPERADRLAEVLHRAYGPARRPAARSYATAAPAVIGVFERLSAGFRAAAYQHTPREADHA
ncbi:TetR/AcrR family transcriptional regulator [Longispora albida]|uniref:TetR/AcrR family transcriptional regulator n=1 Tax=Longispora albida TaxID=203523 RepID=UPI00037AE227|nr:TetR/AcrR family transcriptional regulator [Longispora albida]